KEQVSGKQRQVKPLCRRAQNQQAEGAKKRYNQLIYVIKHNAALRCERRLAILERSETAKRCESLLNALLSVLYFFVFWFNAGTPKLQRL
ncbi:hypothetical protein, partial [Vibrio vulnificus]|uniref:hypothetical protein n=1 Tax=Vibrio vulnificus TaxID=672 RepID=UPI003EDA6659